MLFDRLLEVWHRPIKDVILIKIHDESQAKQGQLGRDFISGGVMKNPNPVPMLLAAMMASVFAATALPALADEPCTNGGGEDLGECKVYIEINASDGDIGLHALLDGEGWNLAQISNADGLIFEAEAVATTNLGDQKLTENFFESTEPACKFDPEEPEEPVQTLAEFLLRFPAGDYDFNLDSGDQTGTTALTHVIPAAPAEVDFNGHDITWEYGDDLGECETPAGFELAEEGDIIGYEVVMEPDDDELSAFTFAARVGPDVNKIRVPKAYLDALAPNTPLKVEIGAIERRLNGSFGNQTFSEEDGFCNNPSQQRCPEDDDEEED